MCKCGLFLVLALLSFGWAISVSIQKRQQSYESYVNMSLLIEKQDKQRIENWTEEFQVQLVDVTTSYRMEMARHQEFNFKKEQLNDKWSSCLNLHQNEATRSEQSYYVRENECLKAASSADVRKRQAIIQVGREIRKWRKSYRYLLNLCQTENLGDKEKAGICLVNYMEKDKYSQTFKRLIKLRSKVVEELHNEMNSSLRKLKECLNTQFSNYLEQIRNVMEDLNKCYNGNEKSLS